MSDERSAATIKERWAHTEGKPWRWDDQGAMPDGTQRDDHCGVVCVWLEPHGFADVLTFGDMECNDGTDLRNSEAVANAPADIAYLLAERESWERVARAQEAEGAKIAKLYDEAVLICGDVAEKTARLLAAMSRHKGCWLDGCDCDLAKAYRALAEGRPV